MERICGRSEKLMRGGWKPDLAASLIGACAVVGRRAGAVDLIPDLSAVRVGGLPKRR